MKEKLKELKMKHKLEMIVSPEGMYEGVRVIQIIYMKIL